MTPIFEEPHLRRTPHLRSSEPKIEEPPIFDLRRRRTGRRSDGRRGRRCNFFEKERGSSRIKADVLPFGFEKQSSEEHEALEGRKNKYQIYFSSILLPERIEDGETLRSSGRESERRGSSSFFEPSRSKNFPPIFEEDPASSLSSFVRSSTYSSGSKIEDGDSSIFGIRAVVQRWEQFSSKINEFLVNRKLFEDGGAFFEEGNYLKNMSSLLRRTPSSKNPFFLKTYHLHSSILDPEKLALLRRTSPPFFEETSIFEETPLFEEPPSSKNTSFFEDTSFFEEPPSSLHSKIE